VHFNALPGTPLYDREAGLDAIVEARAKISRRFRRPDKSGPMS